jgi:hypothetical protein
MALTVDVTVPSIRLTALIVSVAGALVSCASEETVPGDGPEMAVPAVAATADPARDSALVAAAERVVRFRRGEASPSELRLADTVILRLAPEGGGAQVALPRDALADPAGWAVPTHYGQQSLVPPPLPHLTARPGVHFNCLERRLASVAPDLVRLPHVGVRLAPAADANCLQTWNVTLVFAAGDGPPVLVAALYDQWEW